MNLNLTKLAGKMRVQGFSMGFIELHFLQFCFPFFPFFPFSLWILPVALDIDAWA
jgi:hypothetical protein